MSNCHRHLDLEMHTQCYISAASPIPINLPSLVALALLQTYIPTMTQVPDMISFYENPADPALISNDPFFGPWDETVRAYIADEAIHLVLGLTKVTDGPQSIRTLPMEFEFQNRGSSTDPIIEATRLLMPFISWYAPKVMTQLCQSVMDEIVRRYLKIPIFKITIIHKGRTA
ncbi:hypothetical protein B0T10DRAFT_467347 [Thelonectria olida]|uniref:Uncharacterized protein n=1 Tax=Thelonectria olida TaxID=1576542 RepID=A0A9P9AJM5_9HYPO|nr:hypothetical protein B0T10DRAFT_467347 [Thelonectria olida]